MQYLSVAKIAEKWNVSERSVRNYCAQGRVPGAFLTGKTWNIPENAEKPARSNRKAAPPMTLRTHGRRPHGWGCGSMYSTRRTASAGA